MLKKIIITLCYISLSIFLISCGTTTESTSSAASLITPIPSSPINCSSSPIPVTLTWTSASSTNDLSVSYRVMLSDSSDFSSSSDFTTSDTQFQLNNSYTQEGNTYFWKVMATNGMADTGYSTTENFTAIANTPTPSTTILNDGFESGDFMMYSWVQNYGTVIPVLGLVGARSGSYSAEFSGLNNISDTSKLYIDSINIAYNSFLEFYIFTAIPENMGYLELSINDGLSPPRIHRYSGSATDWKKIAFNLTPGSYSFCWTLKGLSGDVTSIKAFLDDIKVFQ